MKGDIPAPAFRLLTSGALRVHTHERKPPERKAGYNPAPTKGRGLAFSLGKKRD